VVERLRSRLGLVEPEELDDEREPLLGVYEPLLVSRAVLERAEELRLDGLMLRDDELELRDDVERGLE